MTNNKTNFHWYGSLESMSVTASNMIVFGAENLKRASVIQHLDLLKQAVRDREAGQISAMDFNHIIHPFIFEKYTDLVKICLFFENYMKAQLIGNGFLIHKINKVNGCESIASKQQKTPISTKELHDTLPFDIDKENNFIYHEALSNQTLPINLFLNKEKYIELIQLPENIRRFLLALSEKRNELHFISVLEFEMSLSYLNDLDLINHFVNRIFEQSINPGK